MGGLLEKLGLGVRLEGGGAVLVSSLLVGLSVGVAMAGRMAATGGRMGHGKGQHHGGGRA